MNTLQELIAANKGTRTYVALAEASNGQLSDRTIHGIATKTAAPTFPTPNTLNGIAAALNLPINDVVLAAAKSAGLNTQPTNVAERINESVPDPDLADLREQIFYHQHHAATYKNQLQELRAHITPRKAQ